MSSRLPLAPGSISGLFASLAAGIHPAPYFRLRLDEEVSRARRQRSLLAVALMRVRSEKDVQSLREDLRRTDIVGFYRDQLALILAESPHGGIENGFSERVGGMTRALLRLSGNIETSDSGVEFGACLLPEEVSDRILAEKLLMGAQKAFEESTQDRRPVIYHGARRVEERTRPLAAPELIAIGDLRIDENRRTVHLGGESVALIRKELDLLMFLLKRAGKSVSRENIGVAVWGHENLNGSRTLDMHIARLRKKLQLCRSLQISTIKGVGYRLDLIS